MKNRLFVSLSLFSLTLSASALTSCATQAELPVSNSAPVVQLSPLSPATEEVEKDVPYVPTPQAVVQRMLELGKVDNKDVIYDLGSGDGRIVVTAAQKYGARGVGIDIDPQRIQEANANAQNAGVSDRVEFRQQDLFDVDLSEASVVTLYLLPQVNLKLRPKLLQQLKPGTKIVSHDFDMGDWKPEQTVEVDGSTIYVWTVPEKVPPNLLKG
ncbi:SAM-dependent methyltransferase [Merismopedia glauca]|uniref:SAM-dependent methyltransferase n=1 Tax=Merismopedia glauca CCAP 1448/3 TaxID=1296344 RepID=A0A2T1C119_9CYAN|nr:class I SAM-dependent methyltransferase [Merismopedia glauca]PSB01868.1 SAM-dependent methyltransferase [Merismopedia glauca CCAP 1448/3]